MNSINEPAKPSGELCLQVIALSKDTNAFGDIDGGWVLSQMDTAGMIMARSISGGRVATVAVGGMGFFQPVPLGAVVKCYASLVDTGRTSMQINVEVWIEAESLAEATKVTDGDFWYVAIDKGGKTRPVKSNG